LESSGYDELLNRNPKIYYGILKKPWRMLLVFLNNRSATQKALSPLILEFLKPVKSAGGYSGELEL